MTEERVQVSLSKESFDFLANALDRADEDFRYASSDENNGYEPEDIADWHESMGLLRRELFDNA